MQVSIIVPAYNAQQYLAECLVSACSQSIEGLEVIVVDDGSTDATPKVIAAMQKHYGSRLIARRIENSGGPGLPRNLGLELARGKYVLFLDADDLLPPNAVARMVHLAEADEADLVIGKRESFKGRRRWVPSSHQMVLELLSTKRATLYDCPDLMRLLAPNAKLVRRSLLNEHSIRFPAGLTYGEDHLFVIQCLYHSRQTSVTQDEVYNYRVVASSSSNTLTPKGIRSYATVLKAVSEFFEERNLQELKEAYDDRRLAWDVLRFAKNAVIERSSESTEIFEAVRECLKLTSAATISKLDRRTKAKVELLSWGYYRAYEALELVDNAAVLRTRVQRWVNQKKRAVKSGKLSLAFEKKLLRLFGQVMPVNPKKVVFAPAFRDHGNVRAVREATVHAALDCKHVMVRHPEPNWRRQVRRAFHLSTARVTLLESYYSPLYEMPLKPEQSVVQLWHGAGAFKRFGLGAEGKDDSNASDFEKRAHAPYTHVIASSEAVKGQYAEAFGCPEDRVVCLGFPRADVLQSTQGLSELSAMAYAQYPSLRGSKVIGYFPTFRGNPYVRRYLSSGFDVGFMRQLGPEYVLMIKPHPEMRAAAFEIPEDLMHRVVIAAPDVPSAALMAVTDVLVTDYSSVIFEFAVLNRPMVFYAPDLDLYLQERGFYWDYESFVPGPIVKSTQDLRDIIAHERYDLRDVDAFAKRFHSQLDGRASRRVVDEVLAPLVAGDR